MILKCFLKCWFSKGHNGCTKSDFLCREHTTGQQKENKLVQNNEGPLTRQPVRQLIQSPAGSQRQWGADLGLSRNDEGLLPRHGTLHFSKSTQVFLGAHKSIAR